MYEEDNKTIWCGNISEQVTEEILYELFLQAGPLEKVKIVKDRDGRQRNFAFITYRHEVSVPYALNLFRGTALFNKALSMHCRGRMVPLPPSIRAYGDEVPLEIHNQNVIQQFAAMTEKIKDDSQRPMPLLRSEMNNELVMASLQGNWLHRHHPYQTNDNRKHGRDDNRHKESQKKHSSHWKDRKRSRNYRRD
ncbi:RNA-binding protein 7 [Pieris napi]|uniref:RRM domain-containing protein n=1 Tax=Pieris macdunnoughi TaxID=345717 RepID=A0A821RSP9_9NEOP|nr:RNA-binding protein 7 [Pieris napi]CAF4847046.1 unnamed protein product [Pieris macdunnoughi]